MLLISQPPCVLVKSKYIMSLTLPESSLYFPLFFYPLSIYLSILKKQVHFFTNPFFQCCSRLSSSSVTLRARGSGRPWLLSVMAASLLTAAVSCGLALNCAPATVNVYVYQSNAMCLCYMALWTRRLSKTHRLEECGPRRGGLWSVEHRRKMKRQSETKGWTEKLVWCCVWVGTI